MVFCVGLKIDDANETIAKIPYGIELKTREEDFMLWEKNVPSIHA